MADRWQTARRARRAGSNCSLQSWDSVVYPGKRKEGEALEPASIPPSNHGIFGIRMCLCTDAGALRAAHKNI